MKGKKAGLDFTINSIVIIIFALVALGLGLFFIKDVFKHTEAKAQDILDSVDLQSKPTASDPFTISTSMLSLSRGSTKMLQAGYYNDEPGARDVLLAVACKLPDGSSDTSETNTQNKYFEIHSPSVQRAVGAAQIAAWQLAVVAKNAAASGTYSCVIGAAAYPAGEAQPSNTVKKSFFIKVP